MPLGKRPPHESPTPRAFTDSRGVTWNVREITPGPMPPNLERMLGAERRRGGWLLFMAQGGEKRRLTPVPEGWAGLSDADLEACCLRARQVPPEPARRDLDQEPPGEA